ncbi:MAG: sugar transferase [Pseudomonadota bacterium]
MNSIRAGSVPDAVSFFQFGDDHKSKLKNKSLRFRVTKRMVDFTTAVIAMPIVFGVSIVLLVLNPFANPGPLFFKQQRMGQGGRPFVLWKFRTMTTAGGGVRGHDDPVETARITPLGRVMRRLRIDELPNFFNVLAGDMCLVGPRPDAYDHAQEYIGSIPHYAKRFRVKPGITGLAQIRGGYADNPNAVRRKARLDLFYVRRSSGRLDAYVIKRTLGVIATGFGAK